MTTAQQLGSIVKSARVIGRRWKAALPAMN